MAENRGRFGGGALDRRGSCARGSGAGAALDERRVANETQGPGQIARCRLQAGDVDRGEDFEAWIHLRRVIRASRPESLLHQILIPQIHQLLDEVGVEAELLTFPPRRGLGEPQQLPARVDGLGAKPVPFLGLDDPEEDMGRVRRVVEADRLGELLGLVEGATSRFPVAGPGLDPGDLDQGVDPLLYPQEHIGPVAGPADQILDPGPVGLLGPAPAAAPGSRGGDQQGRGDEHRGGQGDEGTREGHEMVLRC